MSEDAPRLTRRQMREQGLLDALPADPNEKSPIEKLSETQEIKLNRLSRAEMRRQRQAREARENGNEAAPAPVEETPERVSVFDRFDEANEGATLSETVTTDVTRAPAQDAFAQAPAVSHDEPAPAEDVSSAGEAGSEHEEASSEAGGARSDVAEADPAVAEAAEAAPDGVGAEFDSAAATSSAAPLGDMSLSERLRARLREREEAVPHASDDADTQSARTQALPVVAGKDENPAADAEPDVDQAAETSSDIEPEDATGVAVVATPDDEADGGEQPAAEREVAHDPQPELELEPELESAPGVPLESELESESKPETEVEPEPEPAHEHRSVSQGEAGAAAGGEAPLKAETESAALAGAGESGVVAEAGEPGVVANRVSAALQSAEHDELAQEPEPKPEPEGHDRLHWFVVLVFLLIALTVGVLIGVIAKRLFFADGATMNTLTTLADAYLGSKGGLPALFV